MIRWPDTAVEAVARRRAIVVLGAGSSMHSTPEPGSSRPPDWKSFLVSAAESTGVRTEKSGEKAYLGKRISFGLRNH